MQAKCWGDRKTECFAITQLTSLNSFSISDSVGLGVGLLVGVSVGAVVGVVGLSVVGLLDKWLWG